MYFCSKISLLTAGIRNKFSKEIFVTVLLAAYCRPDDGDNSLLVLDILDGVTNQSLQDFQTFVSSHLVSLDNFTWR